MQTFYLANIVVPPYPQIYLAPNISESTVFDMIMKSQEL